MTTMEHIPNGCCSPPANHAAHVRHTEAAQAATVAGIIAPWRALADRMGERLANHAYSCMSGYNALGERDQSYGELHEPPRAYAGDCPFCADTVAYEDYLKMASE